MKERPRRAVHASKGGPSHCVSRQTMKDGEQAQLARVVSLEGTTHMPCHVW